ncbi:MAG: glucose-1-phosphate cytidylyltransferase [Thermodesulfobacteriota bacterium]
MKVVILCGGKGTRIRDVADDIPKPMIRIGEKPIIWHIMKYYSHWGHNGFVLCLGYKGHIIKDFFLNYDVLTEDFTITLGNPKKIDFHNNHNELGWNVTLAETGLESGTGARVFICKKYLQNEANFMLTYGDGVGNIDIDKLIAFHQAHGKIMTVSGVKPPGRFGELMSDKNGRVTEFNEKPQATGGMISGGYFVCRRELFEYLDDREDLTLELDPMERLVRDGQLMVYEHEGFWHPMDTYRDFLLLNKFWKSGQAPWKVW